MLAGRWRAGVPESDVPQHLVNSGLIDDKRDDARASILTRARSFCKHILMRGTDDES